MKEAPTRGSVGRSAQFAVPVFHDQDRLEVIVPAVQVQGVMKIPQLAVPRQKALSRPEIQMNEIRLQVSTATASKSSPRTSAPVSSMARLCPPKLKVPSMIRFPFPG